MTFLVLTWACHPSSVVQNSFLGFNSCHLWDLQPREVTFFVVCVGVCVCVRVRVCACVCVRVRVRACVCGGVGLGLRRGGSLVNFSQIGEGQTCFIGNRGIFIWARCSTYSATSFSGTIYLSENFLIAMLSPLTSSLSSNNRLI